MPNFSVEGPVEFEMGKFKAALQSNHLQRDWKRDFWIRVEETREGLSSAIGVYTFLIQHGSSLKPWYVGKTSAKGGFKLEVFQNHKTQHYLTCAVKAGSAKMVFFPLLTDSGKLSSNRTVGSKAIDIVETRMIALATARNPSLLNVRDAKLQASIFVPGVFGTRRVGKPAPDAKLARAIFLGSGQ